MKVASFLVVILFLALGAADALTAHSLGFRRGLVGGRRCSRSMLFAAIDSPMASSLSTTAEQQKAVFDAHRPSTVDKARTITHVCTSATLCTSSVMSGCEGMPFGSHVDYILDENGWPVLLLSEQSLHTINIDAFKSVSLFAQLPRAQSTQATAALSRVTVMGEVITPTEEELPALKFAFTLIHPYSEQIVDSPKFSIYKIKPTKIYFAGGFGVTGGWVDIEAYQQARPDVLAAEVSVMLNRVNLDKQAEMFLMCKHFLGRDDVETVRIQAIDRLGVDLRVQAGDHTDEYRLGFRHPVSSSEDAKSEVLKLFQEAWERENGYFFTDTLPPVNKYAEDILRARK